MLFLYDGYENGIFSYTISRVLDMLLLDYLAAKNTAFQSLLNYIMTSYSWKYERKVMQMIQERLRKCSNRSIGNNDNDNDNDNNNNNNNNTNNNNNNVHLFSTPSVKEALYI